MAVLNVPGHASNAAPHTTSSPRTDARAAHVELAVFLLGSTQVLGRRVLDKSFRFGAFDNRSSVHGLEFLIGMSCSGKSHKGKDDEKENGFDVLYGGGKSKTNNQ